MKRHLLIGGAALASTFLAWQVGYAGAAAIGYGDERMLDFVMGGGVVDVAKRDGILEGLRTLVLPTEQAIRYQDHPSVVNATLAGLASGGAWVGALLFLAAGMNRRHPFGNARWAKPSELRSMGVRRKKGFVLGKHGARVLRANDELHTLIVGPTRAGKGVGPLTATALDWPGSLVVFDPKGEIYERTAGYRSQQLNNRIYRFRPLSKETDRYNPLDLVRPIDRGGYTDIEAMADFLVPPSGNQPMWANEAKSLFVGLVGYVLSSDKYVGARNLAEVQRLLVNEKGQAILQEILETEPDLPEFVRGRLGTVANMEAKQTASGFFTQARSAVRSFGNPRVAAATARSDFDVTSIKTTPQTIYVTVSPDELKQSREMLRLVVQQIANVISREAPQQTGGKRVLFMIDEFAKFGHMPELADQLPLMSGYGVNIMLAVQDLPQLDEIYGRDVRGDILANTGRKVILGVNDLPTAELLSREIGMRTAYSDETTTNYDGMKVTGRSKRRSALGQPLMSPDEIMRMSPRRMILLSQGAHPLLGTKLNVFEERGYRKAMAVELPNGARSFAIDDYRPASARSNPDDGSPDGDSPFNDSIDVGKGSGHIATGKATPLARSAESSANAEDDVPPVEQASEKLSKPSRTKAARAPAHVPVNAPRTDVETGTKTDMRVRESAQFAVNADDPSVRSRKRREHRIARARHASSQRSPSVVDGNDRKAQTVRDVVATANAQWDALSLADQNFKALSAYREVVRRHREMRISEQITEALNELPRSLSNSGFTNTMAVQSEIRSIAAMSLDNAHLARGISEELAAPRTDGLIFTA